MFKVTVGENVKFSAIISDLDSVIIDPTGGIKFSIKLPDNSIQSYIYGVDPELEKTTTGKYTINLVMSNIGIHNYKWEALAPEVSIKEDQITVVASTV